MNRIEWEDMVNEVGQYIDKLEQASLSVGELFYDGLQTETFEIFHNYLIGSAEITQVIVIAMESSVDFIPTMKDRVLPYVQELLVQYEHLHLLFSKEHYVALADEMKYQLPKQLKHIANAIKESRENDKLV